MSTQQTVSLGSVSYINPSLGVSEIEADELVDFVPMAAVAADASLTVSLDVRPYEEVKKGYTCFADGDVLLAKITPCFENGKISQIRIRSSAGFGSTEFHVIRPQPDKLDARYLVHLLRQDNIRIEGERRMTGSAGQRRVPKSFLESLPVFLPPLPEQRRIAAILDKADALRTKRREALAQLDRLAQSIFVEMFGDPVTNPKGWPIVQFDSLCSRVTVGIVVQPSSYYMESGVPALRSLNVKAGKIVMDNLVYFSEADNDTKLKKTQLRAGDLVLVRSGQPGTTAVVPEELDGVNAIDILIASPLAEKASSTYLCEFLNSSAGRSLVLSSQRGQIQKHLNVGSLNAAKIMLPSIAIQLQFDDRITAVRDIAVKANEAFEASNVLFASLQHRAFRGEL